MKLKNKIDKKYIFITVLILLIFEFAFMQFIPFSKFIDELYAVIVIPLMYIYKDSVKLDKTDKFIIVLSLLYVSIGLLSNLIFKYQVIQAVLKDILLNLKFFMGIYTTYYLFNDFDYKKDEQIIKYLVKSIIAVLFTLLIIDEIFKIFPSTEIRYGLRSEQLIFGHPTGLASVSFLLLLLLMLFYEKKSNDIIFVAMCCLLVASSLRAKAIAMIPVFLFLFFNVIIRNKKINFKHILILVPIVVLIAWKQIYGYFFGPLAMVSARGALLVKSFRIMFDHFPFGAGLGTFASAPSGDFYSPLYYQYDLSGIWGLEPENAIFVTDMFWPMVFAQTGVIGTIVFILLLVIILVKISKSFEIDNRLYLSGMGAMAYLAISSTSESAFVNPLALPLAFVLDLIFIRINKSNI